MYRDGKHLVKSSFIDSSAYTQRPYIKFWDFGKVKVKKNRFFKIASVVLEVQSLVFLKNYVIETRNRIYMF